MSGRPQDRRGIWEYTPVRAYAPFTPASSRSARTAADPATRPERLTELSKGAPSGVQAALASNPSAPSSLLEELLASDNRRVLVGLAANPKLPASIATALAQHRFASVRGSLSRNAAISKKVLERLLKDDDLSVRASALTNAKVTPERLRLFFERDRSLALAVRHEALANPHVARERVLEWASWGLHPNRIEDVWFAEKALVRWPGDAELIQCLAKSAPTGQFRDWIRAQADPKS